MVSDFSTFAMLRECFLGFVGLNRELFLSDQQSGKKTSFSIPLQWFRNFTRTDRVESSFPKHSRAPVKFRDPRNLEVQCIISLTYKINFVPSPIYYPGIRTWLIAIRRNFITILPPSRTTKVGPVGLEIFLILQHL